MDLTILICTYNSAVRLPETLQHLKNQKHTENIAWEVLIVDYLSTDDTANIARRVWEDYPISLHILNETKPGKTPALETGLNAARGTAVCIIDDDNWVFENYVFVAHTTLQGHPDIGVIGAYGEAHCEIEPPHWFAENEGSYAVGSQGKDSGYVEDKRRLWFWGAGSVIRKEAWLKAKRRGFVPRLNPTRGAESTQFKKGFIGGEDPELCFAIQLVGYRLWYEPSLKYKHFIPQARLSEKFILDAASGVSAAAPILRIYLAEVTPRSFLGLVRKTIYKNWLLHLLNIYLNFAKSLIKLSLLSNMKDKSLTKATIKSSFNAQIRAMYDLRKTFKNLIGSIHGLTIICDGDRH
ncbi:MAG TPA: hypothetical protein DDW41_00390 [Candidatus Andersenbacteria bacterium]|nr:hypothetical protein [Candidatus Andersenbacteria bacterium]HKZ16127.1 glycosyltransferase [Geobacteraceae bacterium]